MEKYKISVIIPIFNSVNWLSRCLNSILNNSYENLEIICINDGSTDNSLDLLRDYEKKDNRIIVVDQPNAGVSAARNKGLEIATGEYISFVDSDDWIHPQHFEQLLKACVDYNADIVVCDFVKTSNKDEYLYYGSVLNKVSPLSIKDLLDKELHRYTVWGKLYKKDIIGLQRFDMDLKLGEDAVFNLSVICKCDNLNMYYLAETLYYYFQRDDSAVHTLDTTLRLQVVKNCYIRDFELFGVNKQFILEQAYRTLLSLRYHEQITNNRSMTFKACRKLLAECAKRSHVLSIKKRALYVLLTVFPSLYRMYRIQKDPTLLEWEKQEKMRRI